MNGRSLVAQAKRNQLQQNELFVALEKLETKMRANEANIFSMQDFIKVGCRQPTLVCCRLASAPLQPGARWSWRRVESRRRVRDSTRWCTM